MVDKQQLAAMGEHMREMEECKTGFKVPYEWMKWEGGDNPIGDSYIEAKLRDGSNYIGLFEEPESWAYTGNDTDIVTYRILQKQEHVANHEKYLEITEGSL